MIILHLILHSTVHIYDFHLFKTSEFEVSDITKLKIIKKKFSGFDGG